MKDRAQRLWSEGRFVTLATADAAGIWAATVNFVALLDPVRPLWYSMRSARHSRAVEESGKCAGSVFLRDLPGFPLDGLQFEAEVSLVGDGEVPVFYERYYELNFPSEAVRAKWRLPMEEFDSRGPRGLYVAQPSRVWLLDIDRWLVDKTDTRVEVEL